MAHYNKGATAERELMKVLFAKGFAVLRVAGSGVNPLPCPDVVALKFGRIIAFECKAWKGKYLAIPTENMTQEIEWAYTAGAEFYIGWKVPHKGWFFVKPEHFRTGGKNYMLTLEDAMKVGVSIETF